MTLWRGQNWGWKSFTSIFWRQTCQVHTCCPPKIWWLLHPTDAHRALGDVQAMKSVLTHPSLLSCLSNLQLRSPSQQLKSWTSQKTLHQKYTSLTSSLSKPAITASQAKKLVSLGLSHSRLQQLHSEAKDEEDFFKKLKAKGVNSKALQAKLLKLLVSKAKQPAASSTLSWTHPSLPECSFHQKTSSCQS